MKPLDRPALTAKHVDSLAELYRTTHTVSAGITGGTHEDDEVETVLRAAAERLALLHLPPTAPGSIPLRRFFRQFRREVTHNELIQTVKSLLAAAREFFDCYNREPTHTLSVMGSRAQNVI